MATTELLQPHEDQTLSLQRNAVPRRLASTALGKRSRQQTACAHPCNANVASGVREHTGPHDSSRRTLEVVCLLTGCPAASENAWPNSNLESRDRALAVEETFHPKHPATVRS